MNRKQLALLTLITLFGTAAANDAKGQELASNTTSTNKGKVAKTSVGVKDLRNEKVRLSEAYAAKASVGSIIVLYSGSDIDKMNDVRQGAANAKADGAPVRGMVLGPADPDFKGGKDSYVVYADGIGITYRLDASDDPEATVQQAIEEAKADYFSKTITPISKDDGVALVNN